MANSNAVKSPAVIYEPTYYREYIDNQLKDLISSYKDGEIDINVFRSSMESFMRLEKQNKEAFDALSPSEKKLVTVCSESISVDKRRIRELEKQVLELNAKLLAMQSEIDRLSNESRFRLPRLLDVGDIYPPPFTVT